MLDQFPFILFAYFIGSIPVGLLIGKARGVDIREHGSGNIGATNAGRVLGQPWGAICFILDVLKGAGPTLAAGIWSGLIENPADSVPAQIWWLAVAFAAIAGHLFPVWLRFRGGKGVATSLGALLSLWPITTLPTVFALLVWVVVARVTRYVGVASVAAAAVLPGAIGVMSLTPLWGGRPVVPVLTATSLLAAIVIWRHRGNLKRTLAGEEPRIGERKPPAAS
jgi:glycerol-3-phosphate acyltransferase PlsY